MFGEPPSLSWLLPTPLKVRYAWGPLDDPDAWDKRDPHIIRHFQELKATLESQEVPAPLPPPQGSPLIPQLRARYLELVGAGAPAAASGAGGAGATDAASRGSGSKAEESAKGAALRRRRPSRGE